MHQQIRSYCHTFLLSCLALLLVGCANNMNSCGTLVRAAPISTCSGCCMQRTPVQSLEDRLLEELNDEGVEVINIGEDYMLIIHANLLFYPKSPRIVWSSYALLNTVAAYLKLYDKVMLKVAGHTDCLGTEKHNVALSLAQARAVANYLWSQDIDARLAFVRGYGSARPMLTAGINHKFNNRIEIIFRKLDP